MQKITESFVGNGITKIFHTKNKFVPGSLRIYHDGLKLSSDNDYAESDYSNNFMLLVTPRNGALINIEYEKSIDVVDVDVNVDDDISENVKTDILICNCHSYEHQIIIQKYLGDYYLNVRLVKFGFWKRLLLGIKYIFGYVNNSNYEEFIFNDDHKSMLENISKSLKNK